ncbi:GntR family transcriptional regulator [Kineothrix sedimenti]|uniref:GntR family transcriptional regulator n=1 Tax=Kineothrix sedimenti TaxID=3123317 RepID=A0ABZ3F292_9FIRM
MKLQPIQKTLTLKEQAYNSIKEAILLNKLEPGTPLTEEQLSATLSISRTPIRSALQQLVYEKLAACDVTGHIYVSTITQKDVDDITVMRSNLEPLGIELISFPVAAEKLHKIKEIQKAQRELVEKHSEDNYQYALLDTMFHNEIAHLCDNSILVETIENLGPIMIRINILSGTLPPYKENAIEEHASIIRFLENNQKDFAVLAMREHVKKVGERIITTLS